jgi:hypothetical protein
VQARMRLSQPSDPAELEADRLADQVLNSNPSPVGGQPPRATPSHTQPVVHRACKQCAVSAEPEHILDDEDAERQRSQAQVMRKENGAASGTGAASGVGAAAVNHAADVAQGGAGREIEAGERQFFEDRFAHDLGGVRVHTGGRAAAAARAIDAQAYTIGRNIVFGEGEYAPGTSAGRSLLAHELAHVLQQEGSPGTLHRREMPFNPVSVARQLETAMAGLGTDEESIYAALSGRTKAQLDEITEAYKNRTGGGDLMKDLRSELTENEWLYLAGLFMSGLDTPERSGEAVAVQLHGAMSGLGTDEDAIYAALNGRSAAELENIKAAYQRLYSEDLIKELKDELSGDELWRALGAMGIAPEVYDQNTELGMLSVGNFDFHFKDCAVLIWVWVKYQFTDEITAAEQATFKTRFVDAVHAKWANTGYSLTGNVSCPCTTVPIRMHVEENTGSFYHKLVDVEKRSDSDRRPNIMRDINVNLNTDDDTLGHEFGHVIGLYDEYDGGFFENIMFWHRNVPSDPDALMNIGTELRPRYFEHYRERVQATAPHGCFYTISSPTPPP